MKISDYLAHRLYLAGMKQVFMVTGGGAMHLNDAFARNKRFQVTYNHHEQASAIAAESYARLTGLPAVVNVTSGPGGLNALTGVHGAYTDSIPMFVVSGQVKSTTIASLNAPDVRQLGDQEDDIVRAVTGITKYARMITGIDQFDEIIDECLEAMLSGRKGPVWLDIPVDIQAKDIEGLHLNTSYEDVISPQLCNTYYKFKQPKVACEEAAIVFQKLKSAKRPVIMVGNGARVSGCVDALGKFISAAKLPVVTCWNAHDLVQDDCEYYVGRPGTVGDRIGNIAVQNADCVLVLGSRLNIRQISYAWENFASSADDLIIVDVDEHELNKPTLNATLKIHSDLEHFLDAMLEQIKTSNYAPSQKYLSDLKRAKRLISSEVEGVETCSALNPYVFLKKLTEQAPDGVTFVCGNGAACVMTFQVAQIKNGTRLYTNSGSASMGYDVPAAIGASMGGGKVMCIAGDGSLMMNIQELQTISYLNLDICIIVLDNGGYLSIRSTQENFFSDNLHGTDASNGVSFPDFCAVARAFGISSHYVDASNFETMLVEMYKSDGPRLFHVKVDPTQNFAPKLAAKRSSDGSIVSPDLADMSPFLSDDLMTEIKNIIGSTS